MIRTLCTVASAADVAPPAARRRPPVPAVPGVLRAARLDHRAPTTARVNALLGTANLMLRRSSATTRAPSCSATAPRRRPTARSSCPRYHADRPPVPASSRGSSSSRGVLRSVRLDHAPARHARGRRPARLAGATGRSRPAAPRCCSPATATCSSASPSDVRVLFPAGGKDRPRGDRPAPRCASATASRPSWCPTSSRCAATRRTASRRERVSGRRRAADLLLRVRHAGGRDRQRDPRATARPEGPARGGGAAARVQGNCDSGRRSGGTARRSADRLPRRGRGRSRARDEPARRAPGAPRRGRLRCPASRLLEPSPILLAALAGPAPRAAAAATTPAPVPLDHGWTFALAGAAANAG